MKNYVMNTSGSGGGIAIRDRTNPEEVDHDKNESTQSISVPPRANIADAGWQMGYWIATLAMEHKLLSDNGF